MGNEVNNLTDEQFKTYNQLLELVEELIEELSNDKKKEYKEKKNDILLKKSGLDWFEINKRYF